MTMTLRPPEGSDLEGEAEPSGLGEVERPRSDIGSGRGKWMGLGSRWESRGRGAFRSLFLWQVTCRFHAVA
jgi:hypothetical protein